MFRTRNNPQHQRGATLVEAALVLPLMLAFLLGIFWFGRAYNIYQTITRAAREGARTGIAPSCALCGNTPPDDNAVATVVSDALAASGMSTSVLQASGYPVPAACTTAAVSCPATNSIEICRHILLNDDGAGNAYPAGSNKVCGMSVRVKYPFSFNLPFTPIGKSTFGIRTEVRMREEQ